MAALGFGQIGSLAPVDCSFLFLLRSCMSAPMGLKGCLVFGVSATELGRDVDAFGGVSAERSKF